MARAKSEAREAPRRLILDSGAVIALSTGDQRARAFLARATALGAPVEIPVVVVAETVRESPRDAAVRRVLRAVDAVSSTTERIGRIAGGLLAQARSSATIDALVVAQAVASGGAHILTGDPDDLGELLLVLIRKSGSSRCKDHDPSTPSGKSSSTRTVA